MKKYNVTSKQTYIKDGVEKATYPRVGRLIHFDPSDKNPDGGMKLELNMFPNTQFYVFEDKPKVDEQAQPEQHQEEVIDRTEPEVTPEDLPF